MNQAAKQRLVRKYLVARLRCKSVGRSPADHSGPLHANSNAKYRTVDGVLPQELCNRVTKKIEGTTHDGRAFYGRR